jgi:hypothetical protein
MWRFGVFPGAGVMPYTIAQLLGSVLGLLGALPVGLSPRPDGGSDARHMAAPDDSAPPGRANPQIMRHPSGWTPIVRLTYKF